MPALLKTSLIKFFKQRTLPAAAQEELRRDCQGLQIGTPGLEETIHGAMRWLCEAQDKSASADGGVARDYSLIKGWSSSYPESTGYIVPTFLDYAAFTGSDQIRGRAARMLEWLVQIQMPCGAFQGGKIDSQPVVPVAFNTGQILLGLVAGELEFGVYRKSLRQAADWLVKIQDRDGCWRQGVSPFACAGEKTYDAHIAWSLFEAARIEPQRGYQEAALANLRWVMTYQRDNGWMDKCCLDDPSAPFTHTLGYVLRGLIEGYRYSGDPDLLEASRKMADGLRRAVGKDGFLPGRLNADWHGVVQWACLTGSAQLAICWLILYELTSERRYQDAAFAVNSYVRRTVLLNAPAGISGGVKGSFPVDGDYNPYEYPSWAAKFLIDSLLQEHFLKTKPTKSLGAVEFPSSAEEGKWSPKT